MLQPKKLRSVRKAPDRELRRANHPPAESYGVPAPYPTPLATHRALQGGMARAARHRDSPIPHGDRETGMLDVNRVKIYTLRKKPPGLQAGLRRLIN